MIGLWVPHTVLFPRGGGIADEVLLSERYRVPFRRVNGLVELQHCLDFTDENRKVILLVAAIVGRQDGSTPRGHFGEGGLFWRRRLGESIQRLTPLVSGFA
jgi:hypothetical protein